MIELADIISRMKANAGIIQGLATNLRAAQESWKPAPDKWSILEVINHLYDEEREDFRQRLEFVLRDPQAEWPGIAPQEWVTSRAYCDRDLPDSLNNFLSEREKSLAWLQSLTAPRLENRHERQGRTLSAGDLLTSWLAHDFLHIRQLTRLHWQYLNANSAPFKTEYAGPWPEA